MTLFFNMQNLVRETKGDPLKTLNLLEAYMNQKILKYGVRTKLQGKSFLLAPNKLFADRHTDILYRYQYLILAAKRDFSLYKLYGVKSLPLSHYPDIKLSSIRTNPLLVVTNSDIHFKYEE